jgi:hypothetical protein
MIKFSAIDSVESDFTCSWGGHKIVVDKIVDTRNIIEERLSSRNFVDEGVCIGELSY